MNLGRVDSHPRSLFLTTSYPSQLILPLYSKMLEAKLAEASTLKRLLDGEHNSIKCTSW